MRDYVVNLGINEKATIVESKSVLQGSGYTDFQSQLNQYVTHDIIYEYAPNINGGYVVLIDPGPWPELLQYDERMKDKYGSALGDFKTIIYEFIRNSLKLAFQIDPGAMNASSDSYNLRHLNQNVFSYNSKIQNVSITYLEEKNIVEFTHNIWFEFMEDLKKGFVELPDEWLAKDTDIFYPVPYYGQIWAYAYNPVDLKPREIIKYIGVFPSSESISESYGQRGQNEHYMKSITYNVVDMDRAVYPATQRLTTGEHFQKFYRDSVIFKEFIDKCAEFGLVKNYKGTES